MKNIVYRVNTIHELYELIGFGKPAHPLVAVVDYSKVKVKNPPESGSFVCSFYTVNFKKNCKFLYGRQPFDHQEGTLHCTAPDQVITFNRRRDIGEPGGWGLYFHPELIRRSDLGTKIHGYSFFSYSESEALHLSEAEKQTLYAIVKQLDREINSNVDVYSQNVIVSAIGLLLNYCMRFYGRQFITRTNQNKDILARFEAYLREYAASDAPAKGGLPEVKQCARALSLSPNYFSDLVKSETGKNAQEHIHCFLLDAAKSLLLNTNKTISEIAYELGFEYPQYFSRLFKNKTGITPTRFRNSLFKN